MNKWMDGQIDGSVDGWTLVRTQSKHRRVIQEERANRATDYSSYYGLPITCPIQTLVAQRISVHND